MRYRHCWFRRTATWVRFSAIFTTSRIVTGLRTLQLPDEPSFGVVMTIPARLTRFALGAFLCASAMSQPVAAIGAAPKVPPIAFQQRTLGNGLRVIAIRDTTTPNVMTSMWYEVGSKHDPDGRSGFAHLFEHILSQKTVNIPFLGIAKMVDDMGGTRNASTWFDQIGRAHV